MSLLESYTCSDYLYAKRNTNKLQKYCMLASAWCRETFGWDVNPFYSVFYLPLFTCILCTIVYCPTDCFLLKVYLLPPSLVVCPGSGRGLWCTADTWHRGSCPGWAARTVAMSGVSAPFGGLRPFGCSSPAAAPSARQGSPRRAAGRKRRRHLPAAPLVVPGAGARNGRRRLAQGPRRRRRRHGPGVQVRTAGEPPPPRPAWPAPEIAVPSGGAAVRVAA